MRAGRVEEIGADGAPRILFDATAPEILPEPSPSSAASWPEPLKATAFHGVIGDLAKLIEPHTESDTAAVLVQSIVAAGNIIGPHARFRAEGDDHRGNLFAVLVGETSKGRKGTSWGIVRRVFREVDPEWEQGRVLSGLSSGEGLIWSVRDPGDGHGGDDDDGDQGVTDKRALIVEAEFSSPLRVMERAGNTLSAVIRDAWDTGNLRTLTKNCPAKATGAHVSIIGHSTQGELLRYLSSTERGNGFGNRILWVSVRRSKILPEGGQSDKVDFSSITRRLREAVDFARTTRDVRRDDAARKIWRAVYAELSEGKPGMVGSMTSRAEAQVLRLSLLYAVLDCSAVVREEHLLAALAVWDYADASVKYIFRDATGHPEADTILKALMSTMDGLTRTDISCLFGRHKAAREIDQALAVIESLGRAKRYQEPTSGRPIDRWKAVRPNGN